MFDQKAGDDGRECDTEIAAQAIDADGPARPAGMLHQHRDANRMVDGSKAAQNRQCHRQLQRRLGLAHQQCSRTHAKKEHQHHRTAAPAIAQSSGWQRANAIEKEGRHAVGHEVLPAGNAKIQRDTGDSHGKDQQKHMVDGMPKIEQVAGGG